MKKILFVLILLVSGIYFYEAKLLKFFEKFKSYDQDVSEKISESRLAVGYILDNEKWTSFVLPPETKLLKILTNANFPKSFQYETQTRWWYVIQFQILDRNKNILSDRLYHHYTKITKYIDPDTKKTFEPRFYLNIDLMPGDLKIMLINLLHIQKPAYIRFRISWKAPEIKDVVLRAYYEEQIPQRKISYMWHRLSRDLKINLARGNVYPYELLTDWERLNILRKMWRPMGPSGIEGRDYIIRKIYVLKEIEGERLADSIILPQGFFIDKNHKGTIPIPEKGGRIRIEITGIGEQLNKIEQIKILWFGNKFFKRSQNILKWDGNKHIFEKTFESGILEIETTKDIIIKVFLIKDDQKEEITPEILNLRTYLTHLGLPVTFNINHIRNYPTPFRIDFRYINPKDKTLPVIYYEMLSVDGQIVKQGTFTLSEEISLYDRIHGDMTGQFISEPIKKYFSLPPEIAQIRFFSKLPVLISAYDRPPALIRQTRVPEDYHKYNLKDELSQPAWFPVWPVNYKKLILENRSILLIVQHRPPKDSPELTAGQYEWEPFYSQGLWKGRYLFTPWEQARPVRKEQLRAIYRQIPVQKESVLYFKQPVKGLKTLSPRVFFLRKNKNPIPISIFIDGKLVYKIKISSTRGEIQLPAIVKGKHKIKILCSEDIKFYINYTGPGNNALIKRFANRINKKGLQYLYEKKTFDKETLLLHFFSPASQPAIITAKVKKQKKSSLMPLPDWTYLERKYIIQPDSSGKSVPVLHTPNEFTDKGQVFYLTLGANLEPGIYPIDFTIQQANEGYLIFSKITQSIFEKRDFFREKEIINEKIYQ